MFVALIVLPCFPTDSDYENANRSADVDVELMAFQSIIGDDYKGHNLFKQHAVRSEQTLNYRLADIINTITILN